jgi:hypothetical protein
MGPRGSEKRLSSGQSPDPIAWRRKPEGKGFSAGLHGWKSGRGCLGWRGNAPARGRQARPDLSRDKSGKKGNWLYRI